MSGSTSSAPAAAAPRQDASPSPTTIHAPSAAFRLPAGAWDCHAHVFEREPEFPFSPTRTFKPGVATLEMLRDMRAALGLAKTVIVQASVYGTDNRLMLDVLERENGNARGVAVIDDGFSDARLEAMRAAGVRGVRLNLETFGLHEPSQARERLKSLAAQVAPLGWHVQLYTRPDVLAALADTIMALPCQTVLDHFACLRAELGADQPGYAEVMAMLRGGNVWIKLSAPSRASHSADHAELEPLVRALAEARPQRLLWGSDWPHTGGLPAHLRSPGTVEPFKTVNDRRNAWQLSLWLPPTLQQALWVDNPATLYS